MTNQERDDDLRNRILATLARASGKYEQPSSKGSKSSSETITIEPEDGELPSLPSRSSGISITKAPVHSLPNRYPRPSKPFYQNPHGHCIQRQRPVYQQPYFQNYPRQPYASYQMPPYSYFPPMSLPPQPYPTFYPQFQQYPQPYARFSSYSPQYGSHYQRVAKRKGALPQRVKRETPVAVDGDDHEGQEQKNAEDAQVKEQGKPEVEKEEIQSENPVQLISIDVPSRAKVDLSKIPPPSAIPATSQSTDKVMLEVSDWAAKPHPKIAVSVPAVSIPKITSPLRKDTLLAEEDSSLRLKILIQEYERQHALLVDTHESFVRIAESLARQRSVFQSNLNTLPVLAERESQLKAELEAIKRQAEALSEENLLLQSIISDLEKQLSSSEGLFSSLNENVVKKKALISQLQLSEGKSAARPVESSAKIAASEAVRKQPAELGNRELPTSKSGAEKKNSISEALRLDSAQPKPDLAPKANLFSNYQVKLREAFRKLLENKLSIFKLSPNRFFPVADFLVHLTNIFQKQSDQRPTRKSPGSPTSTYELVIFDSIEERLRTLSSCLGIIDVKESFGLIAEDPQITLEKYFFELLSYFYLAFDKSPSLDATCAEFARFVRPDRTFSLITAIEHFSALLIRNDFSPTTIKSAIPYAFVSFDSDAANYEQNLLATSEMVAIQLPVRIFSRQLEAFFVRVSNESSIPPLTASQLKEIEVELERNPENILLWIEFALAGLPSDVTCFEKFSNCAAGSFDCCLSRFATALESNSASEDLWISYLDVFSIHCDYDPSELSDVYRQAIDFCSNKLSFSVAYAAVSRDLPTKIGILQEALSQCYASKDRAGVGAAIFAILFYYQEAGYVECAANFVYSLFLLPFTTLEKLLAAEEQLAAPPSTVHHSSFISSLFHASPDFTHLNSLLWMVAIHFLIWDCLPDDLFFDFPFESVARLDCYIQLNFSNLPAGKSSVLQLVANIFDFLSEESNGFATDFIRLNRDYFRGKHPENRDGLDACSFSSINQHLVNASPADCSLLLARHIREFITSFDAANASVGAVSKILQRSLGHFTDFDKISTEYPSQRGNFIAWVNYFIFAVKNKLFKPADSAGDQNAFDTLLDASLEAIGDESRLFLVREYIAWILLCGNADRVRVDLSRLIEESATCLEIWPAFRVARHSHLLFQAISQVLKKFTPVVDAAKRRSILGCVPIWCLPEECLNGEDPLLSGHGLLMAACRSFLQYPASSFVRQWFEKNSAISDSPNASVVFKSVSSAMIRLFPHRHRPACSEIPAKSLESSSLPKSAADLDEIVRNGSGLALAED